ncbi:hypothetical protein VP01_1870g3 [Puccinia sorghi]|uniref:Uncharacterized protein n=1 Tax=Puccinia sorghi TaxID=27349 RepID=A0A0L6VF37_9BASI|nr:hypothetical protein VP01_1870g3 [Puccinia sorghi]
MVELGGIKYDQIHNYLINWFSKIHHFKNHENACKEDQNPQKLSQNPQQDYTIQLAFATCRPDLMVMEQLFSDSRIYSKLDTEQSTCTLHESSKQYKMQSQLESWPKQEEQAPIDSNHYYDHKERSGVTNSSLVINNHSMLAMYFKKFRLLRSLKRSLIKISSFWRTQLIQVVGLSSQLIKGRNYLTIRILISINILHSHKQELNAIDSKTTNLKEMKDTMKWIIIFVVLHNILADMKDQWNELYEEDEPDSSPMALST